MSGQIVSKKQDKVVKILAATIEILAKKGYENTTINDIADNAKMSRGLLHYYFKDKEDLVAQALTFGFGSMWESSVGNLQSARSPEQLVDNMIEVLKKNTLENPDFSALLFEMWVSSRRSAKIHKVFSDGLNETIDRLKGLLQVAASLGIVKADPSELEGIVRTLIALYHGLTIQLLTNPEKVRDKKMWVPIRKMLLSSFKTAGDRQT
jgi:AcrR family transcriptional regulator